MNIIDWSDHTYYISKKCIIELSIHDSVMLQYNITVALFLMPTLAVLTMYTVVSHKREK